MSSNSFPIRREPMDVGERRQFRMAWVFAPELTLRPQVQGYTRLAEVRPSSWTLRVPGLHVSESPATWG